MPRSSSRQGLLRSIRKAKELAAYSALLEEEDALIEDEEVLMHQDDPEGAPTACQDYNDLLELEYVVANSRYSVSREIRPKSREFVELFFQEQTEDEFLQATRMSTNAFKAVLSLIEGHPAFQSDSYHQQAPVFLLLACVLERFGKYGTGASIGSLRRVHGVAHGTVPLYTRRVIEALCDLADRAVRWPDKREKQKMQKELGLEGFPGCIGFIDGTTFPLAQKPAVHGEVYYDRKRRYSINAQVICDNRRRIIALHSGHPGSCADVSVYREMDLFKFPERYFEPGEYLLADSAYPISETCVSVYKGQRGKERDNSDFNMCVAHVRVVNEHTIGVLKNRFSSLQEVCIQVNNDEDVKRVNLWIAACTVLHNILMELNDVWDDMEECDDDEDEVLGAAEYGVQAGEALREKVKAHCLQVQRSDPFSFLSYRTSTTT